MFYVYNVYEVYTHTFKESPFSTNLPGDNSLLLWLGLPSSSDDDSEPLESEDSEEPEPDADSLLDEEEEVCEDGDLTSLVLFTANRGGIGIGLALIK